MVRTFARAARQRIRLDSGGYRRDHLRALAQRVEVADTEVRIMGAKSELLRTLGFFFLSLSLCARLLNLCSPIQVVRMRI